MLSALGFCSKYYSPHFKLQKGLSSAQADNTKGLKGAILDWIIPPGQSLLRKTSRSIMDLITNILVSFSAL